MLSEEELWERERRDLEVEHLYAEVERLRKRLAAWQKSARGWRRAYQTCCQAILHCGPPRLKRVAR